MEILVIVIVVALLCIASATRRTARNSRRVPCKTCGYPLLPNSRVCPNCRGPGAWKVGLIEKWLANKPSPRGGL